MKVGITGHQKRSGIPWLWVKETIGGELDRIGRIERALSSLASGSDQIFAEAAMERGIPVLAVIPLDGYDKFFKGADLSKYRDLLARSEPKFMPCTANAETAFLEAGKYIVREVDVLFAVWDGEKAEGKGGTGDVVQYAHEIGHAVTHINPISRAVKILTP